MICPPALTGWLASNPSRLCHSEHEEASYGPRVVLGRGEHLALKATATRRVPSYSLIHRGSLHLLEFANRVRVLLQTLGQIGTVH